MQLWIHPYLPAPELVRRFTPLARYLEEKTGRKIEIKISPSYENHEKRLGEDRADIAFVGPFSYVHMSELHGSKTILAAVEGNGKAQFHGVIAVRQDGPIKTIQDLAGRSFAFGDKESTMGTLLPRFMLREAGLGVDRLSHYTFLNSHNDVALAILGGIYDAGGLKEEVFHEYASRGLRILAKSPPVPEHLFLAGKKLPAPLVKSLRSALLQLKDPAVLTPIQKTATGMAPATDQVYDGLRHIARNLGPMPGE
ncbi:MAG: phosphate/phosphite/phosphonate ABC transporter substrate-binding protein [Desulfobulbaceae bacterium]|nr:phosphate/phosphite/phosphonate ABC transporter substrate-binding protein [Desulfobulbaceae bacterium]HIJ89915.1 phosphate/phosphite/phosphonate ABC transporter substrate-binding protein [Deltaproteobacteria bacterium]